MLDQSNISSAADQKTVTYNQFSALDIRVGTVVSAEIPEWSNKLLQFTVDFGPLGTKTIFSGVKNFYQPEDFIGKQFCFLYNLEPKKIMGKDSNGMILVADIPEKFELIPLDKKLKNGTVIR